MGRIAPTRTRWTAEVLLRHAFSRDRIAATAVSPPSRQLRGGRDMRSGLKRAAAVAASIALVASSTAAVAAGPAPAPTAAYQAPNAWIMLSALSPSGASVVGSASAA